MTFEDIRRHSMLHTDTFVSFIDAVASDAEFLRKSANVFECRRMSSNVIVVIECLWMPSNAIECLRISSMVVECHQGCFSNDLEMFYI